MEKYSFCFFLYVILKFKLINLNNLNNSLINYKIYNSIRIMNDKTLDYFHSYKKNNSNLIKTNKTTLNINNNFFKEYKNSTVLKKNLIIGSIIGYDWEAVAPFFKSFEQTVFENCDCVMFVGQMTPSTIDKIKSIGVIVHPIPYKYKFLNVVINNYRWEIYETFINENINKYNIVLTADVRDTFFQFDFFKLYQKTKSFLGVAFEDNILTQTTNKNWIVEVFGEDIYENIKNERIICSGTIWGTADKFYEFSKKMWEVLKSKWSKCFKIIDQAVANYLIYHEKLFIDCLIKSETKDGPVMTIGFTNDSDIIFDSKNNILNRKGEIGAVIHQYDRKPDIVKKVINKYCIKGKFLKGKCFNYMRFLLKSFYLNHSNIIIGASILIFELKYYKK